MNDEAKSREQLINELVELRKQAARWRDLENGRKGAKKSLGEQSQILEVIFKHTIAPLAILDRDFNFIRVNEAYARTDHRDVSEFPGNNHFTFYPSDAKAIFEQVVKTKKPFQAFARPFTYHHHPERGVTYWDWTLVPVLDAAGVVELLIFSLNDVTERVRAEKELKELNQRLFSLLDGLPAFVYLQAPDYSIRFANRYFWEQFGEPQERTCYEILHGYKEPCKICSTIRVFHTQSPQNWEWTRFDGRSYQIYNYPFSDLDGSPLVLVLGIDITENKRLEKEMARLDRLNMLGEMAAGIGHEVRNPMTTIRGFLQLLGSKIECVQHRQYFDLMIEELDRANSIITEFLSLAKNKAVDLKLQNLNSIIENLFPLMQADAMVSDKYITTELQEIPEILLDEKEIRQMILNLARNGLEAMSPGGKLTIRTFKDCEELVLSVQDQGNGIKSDLIEKIGTPFFTTKEQGTGLGLAVCYGIAARHNATVKVDTGPTGTTFFIRFRQ